MGWPGGVFPGGCNDLRGVWGWLSFSCGMAHCGKSLISVFQGFFASIGGACILAGGLGIGLRHFPVSLQSFVIISLVVKGKFGETSRLISSMLSR